VLSAERCLSAAAAAACEIGARLADGGGAVELRPRLRAVCQPDRFTSQAQTSTFNETGGKGNGWLELLAPAAAQLQPCAGA
jgi:hypothetical protein